MTHQEPSSSRSVRTAQIALACAHRLPLEPRYRLASNASLLVADPTARCIANSLQVKLEIAKELASTLHRAPALAERADTEARQANLRLVAAADTEYPSALRQLELQPPCLFCRADSLAALHRPGLGIVGPRNADPYGLEAARIFARELSTAGLVITSGFARGVDAAAHREAATAGNPTIAVLGCGPDVEYPKQNRDLVQPIVESGGIVLSEFPLGTPPAAWRFPLRNRIIAALTVGMLVVQATRRSGSLISARLALEQGRDVYAVPGRIFDVRSRGTNELLSDGAHVALSPQSILDTLPQATREELLRLRLGSDGALRRSALEQRLGKQPATAEELATTLGIEQSLVLADLTELELDEIVIRRPGGSFQLAGGRS